MSSPCPSWPFPVSRTTVESLVNPLEVSRASGSSSQRSIRTGNPATREYVVSAAPAGGWSSLGCTAVSERTDTEPQVIFGVTPIPPVDEASLQTVIAPPGGTSAGWQAASLPCTVVVGLGRPAVGVCTALLDQACRELWSEEEVAEQLPEDRTSSRAQHAADQGQIARVQTAKARIVPSVDGARDLPNPVRRGGRHEDVGNDLPDRKSVV